MDDSGEPQQIISAYLGKSELDVIDDVVNKKIFKNRSRAIKGIISDWGKSRNSELLKIETDEPDMVGKRAVYVSMKPIEQPKPVEKVEEKTTPIVSPKPSPDDLCFNCQKFIGKDAQFCKFCGEKQYDDEKSNETEASPKSPEVELEAPSSEVEVVPATEHKRGLFRR